METLIDTKASLNVRIANVGLVRTGSSWQAGCLSLCSWMRNECVEQKENKITFIVRKKNFP